MTDKTHTAMNTTQGKTLQTAAAPCGTLSIFKHIKSYQTKQTKKNPIFLNMCSNRQDPGESLPIWQVVPSHWGGHKHSNPSSLSMQVPPPAHGLDAHSSKSDKTQVCELQVSTLSVNVEEKTHCWHRSDPPIRTDTGTRTLLEPRGTFLRWHRGWRRRRVRLMEDRRRRTSPGQNLYLF